MISSPVINDSGCLARLAHRTLKQLQNNVKREILTVHFSKTDAAAKLPISDAT
jgi:hypothetical protein